MAADFDKPTVSNTHVNVLPQIIDNQTSLARMFSDGGEANVPLRSVRFLNNIMYLWNGSIWEVAPVAIGGGGTGAQTTATARASLGTDEATNVTSGVFDADRIPTLSIADKTSGTLDGDRVDQSTTSERGTVQLNNTLTSTSTTQALTAAQGKALKDAADALIQSVVIQGNTIGASTGSITVARTGNTVSITGALGHSSNSTFSTDSLTIPVWAIPPAVVSNCYTSDIFLGSVSASISTLHFRYRDFSGALIAKSGTSQFSITYSV